MAAEQAHAAEHAGVVADEFIEVVVAAGVPRVEAEAGDLVEADGTDEVTFAQRELPTITGEMLNALRLNGKTLVVEADNYTIRIDNGRVAELLSNDYRPGVQNLSMNLYIIERESLIQLVRDASVRGLVYFERDILARNLSLDRKSVV